MPGRVVVVTGMAETDFYVDIQTSPRPATAKDDWPDALDAFGVPLADVAAESVRLVDIEPGVETGRIYSLLTPAPAARGIVRIMGHRMSGRMKSEP